MSLAVTKTYLENEPSVGNVFLSHDYYITIEQAFVAILPPYRFYDFARATAHKGQQKQREYGLYDNARVRRFILIAC